MNKVFLSSYKLGLALILLSASVYTNYECKCGQANRSGRRIVGGDDTEKNEYPWQVRLKTKIVLQNGLIGIGSCGGSIISKKEILTAAHCLFPKDAGIFYPSKAEDIDVVVGEHHIKKADGERIFKVCSLKVHESYDYLKARSRKYDYDYAILTLCEEIQFSKVASPICLPETSGQDPELNEDVDAWVTGWGRGLGWPWAGWPGSYPSVLQEIKVKTMTTAKCGESPRQLCGKVSGKSMCKGDSGGPWVTEVGRNYVLIGISSLVLGPCIRGYPGVAARVSNQLGWIKSNMHADTCPRLQ